MQRIGRIVKTLNVGVNPSCEDSSHKISVKYFHNTPASVSSDPHTIRRQNALSLFQQFAEERIAAGEQPKGLEIAFAEKLGISGATWSMAKSGSRPIGDKLARQFEHRCALPAGWMDEERAPQGLSQAEQQFLASALEAYRGTNSDGRKQLRQLIKTWNQRTR
ncbi:hypothetical protein Mpe_B0291 (plasmid) [Methylibium petroleiphilum PM1]|uniref:Uncharacterized protein n=1 Tax=Methylibium petroleiphilum (strain ATCC BAA-1232 / LMG 22953 / PM1) TaxID=420662 RepID=A2SNC7_METPP|nr:hypothetical protein Mpe_B0291 [Methylibium petroleiphilum PM1]